MPTPDIQLIANVIVRNNTGDVLLTQYDTSDESGANASPRWWLPGSQLAAYQHPDDAANSALESLEGIEMQSMKLSRVQSFRGRRGWHISFDYLVVANGIPTSPPAQPAKWFKQNDLPDTMHGNWEKDTVAAVLTGEQS